MRLQTPPFFLVLVVLLSLYPSCSSDREKRPLLTPSPHTLQFPILSAELQAPSYWARPTCLRDVPTSRHSTMPLARQATPTIPLSQVQSPSCVCAMLAAAWDILKRGESHRFSLGNCLRSWGQLWRERGSCGERDGTSRRHAIISPLFSPPCPLSPLPLSLPTLLILKRPSPPLQLAPTSSALCASHPHSAAYPRCAQPAPACRMKVICRLPLGRRIH